MFKCTQEALYVHDVWGIYFLSQIYWYLLRSISSLLIPQGAVLSQCSQAFLCFSDSWAPVVSLSLAGVFLSAFQMTDAVRGKVGPPFFVNPFFISHTSLSCMSTSNFLLHGHGGRIFVQTEDSQSTASAHISAYLFKSLFHNVCEKLCLQSAYSLFAILREDH